jgi:hypothetical protein
MPKKVKFRPGSSHIERVPFTVTPSMIAYTAELYLGRDSSTKAATSGPAAFTSTGAAQVLNLPVVMPTAGTYHVYVRISEGDVSNLHQEPNDVTVGR